MKNTRLITRRQAVTGVATAFAASAATSSATAQDNATAGIPEHIGNAIADATYAAESLLTDVSVNEELTVAVSVTRLRETQTYIAAVLNPDKLQIAQSKVSAHCLYRHEVYYLNQTFQRLEVSTTTVDNNTYASPEKVTVSEEESETCWDVVQAIVFETFGIDRGIRKGVSEVLKRLNIDQLAGDIIKNTKSKNWAKTAQLLRRLLLKLMGRQVLEELEKRIGKVAMRKFLTAIGSRFVPWVGTALLVASLLIAIKNNHQRFENCK